MSLKSLLLVAAAFTLSAPVFAKPAPNKSAAALKVGEKAPDFSVAASDGKTYKLSELTKAGKTVVLEWFNKDCPYVRKFYDAKKMQELQKTATSKPNVVWFSVASNAKGKEGHLADAASADKLLKEKGMSSTAILIDNGSALAKLYGAKTTPHMFVIDSKGLLAYQGAIDDHPSASAKSLEGANNFVMAALTSLEKNEPIAVTSQDPYGCSVKY